MKALKVFVACAVALAVSGSAFGAWTYSNKKLTDGDWTFNCTASGTSLTLGAVATVGSAEKTIDLTDVEGGYSIVAIGKSALINGNIVKVILPNTVTSIGESAFGSNKGIREVVLSESLTMIGNGAFSGCSALTNVVPFLPASLTSIGTRAFQGAGVLNDLVITGSNLTSIPGEASYGVFKQCVFKRVDLSGSAITSIGGSAFGSCPNLGEVLLPDTLEEIGTVAFASCTALTNVVPFLPPAITSIGTRCFMSSPIASPLRISSADFATFPSDSGSYSPFGGTKIPSADFSGSGLKTITQAVFNGLTSLTNVVFSDVLEEIGYQAFQGCSNLKSVSPCFPDSLKTIGGRAFYQCAITNALRVTNPEFTTVPSSAGYGVFLNNKIPSVDFSRSGLLSLGANAFQGNTALTNAVLPETLTTIEGSAFNGCSALCDVWFLSTDMPTFGSNAFNSTPGDYKARFRYPATGTWALSRTSNFKPWDDASITDANRQTYADTFADGTVPDGIDKFNNIIKCMVPVVKEVGDSVNMTVFGEPDFFGTPDPDYGDYEDVGSITGTVPQYGVNGHAWGESVGYRVDTLVDLAWVEGEPVMGERSVSYTPAKGGFYRLAWLWDVIGYKVALADFNRELGSVSVTSADYGENYYSTNTTVVFEATPAVGIAFDRWTGDIPAGHERDNPLRIAADAEKSVAPYFVRNWVYDGSETISDGNWEVKVSGTADALTATGVKTASVAAVLDLRKPIADVNGTACVLVKILKSAFQSRSDICEVRLPDTLTEIGESGFAGCPKLQKIEPFLPASVTNLGNRVFLNSPIASPLRISNPNFTALPTENLSYGVFMGTKIPSIDLSGSGLRDLGASNFNGLTSLTNAVLTEALEAIGTYSFVGCTALKTVSPFLPATLTNIGARAFYNCPIESNLTLSNRKLVALPSSAQYGVFVNSKFEVADLSHGGITNSGEYTFSGNTALKKVMFPKTLEILGSRAFAGCTALLDTSFRSNPTISGEAYRNAKVLPARATFPKGDAGWMQRIADAGTGFHPWVSATAAQSNDYLANFPARPAPLGYMSIGGVNKWLVPVSETGMRIIFR